MLRTNRFFTATVACALALGLGAVGPRQARADAPMRHYRLIDVGTLGGSLSTLYDFDEVNFTPHSLNARGDVALTSLTASGFAAAAEWSHDHLAALASLPNANVGGGGSNATAIGNAGVVIGAADDGVINPDNGAPFDHAVFWDARGIHRLAELDGHASWANDITDDGVIVGYANDGLADPYTYAGTQTHAVVWRGDGLRDLGTLGGTDSAAFLASRSQDDHGVLRVIGTSSLATSAGPPFGIPQTDAFVWEGGALVDLGTLGGGFTTPSDINGAGRITVISFDASNQHFQSFVWDRGRRVGLEALGDHFVEAAALDESGTVAGAVSDAMDQTAIAAVWDAWGHGMELGTIAGDSGSVALDISAGVAVGGSGAVSFTAAAAYAHAFVWYGAGAPVDLNTLLPAGSPLTLHVAYAIDEQGRIAGLGTDAAGDTHVFLLEPDEGCAGSPTRSEIQATNAPARWIRGAGPLGIARGRRAGRASRF